MPALPFCHIKLTAAKPTTSIFGRIPAQVVTVGDHLRQRRVQLVMTMKQAGKQLGVTASTIWNWENNRTQSELRYLPTIIEFLGYNPLPDVEDLAGKLRRARWSLGLTHAELANRLGVDQSTIAHWEQGTNRPTGPYRKLLEIILTGVAGLPETCDSKFSDPNFSPGKLRAAMKKLGLSPAALARKLGTSAHTLRRWERGDRKPHGLYRKLAANFLRDAG